MNASRGSRKLKERAWRRLTLAVPVSLLLHIILAVLMQPDYQGVSDIAIDMDVIEVAPGPPATPSTPEPKPEPEAKTKPVPKPAAAKAKVPEHAAMLVREEVNRQPDFGVHDAGSVGFAGDAGARVAGAVGDAGSEGGGICMHDLLPFSEDDPSWILWLSLNSFRGTVFQKDLGDTLSAYQLSRRIASATGIDAAKDAESLLVTTSNVFDWRSFRIFVTYDSGEEKLRRKLTAVFEKESSFSLTKTPKGWKAQMPGEFSWHLVGSGRLLAIAHAPPSPAKSAGGDAGLSSPSKSSGISPGLTKQWPEQVRCVAPDERSRDTGNEKQGTSVKLTHGLRELARSYRVPDADGHWPVALLATRDPRAVGIGSKRARQLLKFRFAVVRAYFQEPVRIEGQVHFAGEKERIAALAAGWRNFAARASKDPFFVMAGLSHMFDGLTLEAGDDRISFSIEMTQTQVRAALFFIQMQAEALERNFR